MHEIFIGIGEKSMEKEYILQFLPSLKVSGNYGKSKDAEWSIEQIAVKALNAIPLNLPRFPCYLVHLPY